ncbi:hypothetical protein ACFLU6_02255 [Acidobacteriota bacterium]
MGLTKIAWILFFVFSISPLSLAWLHGDPRWWWDDTLVAGGTGAVASIDVAVAPKITDDAYPPPIFVAWIEPSVMIEGSLRLTASFDGGCTFCPPLHIGTIFNPDAEVALAVGITSSGRYSIQIAQNDSGTAQVLYDTTSIPISAFGDDGCVAFLDVATSIRRITVSGGGIGTVLNIDLAGYTSLWGMTQFHCVWEDARVPNQNDIYHAADLVGDGSWGVEHNITSGTPARGNAASPSVSMDFKTDEDPPLDSAVNVVFTDYADNNIYYLRSLDSGTTFTGTGGPGPVPPVQVSDSGGTPGNGRASIDSGLLGASSTESVWHGVVWEWTGFFPAPIVKFDGQYNAIPDSPGIPWQADFDVQATAAGDDGHPAVSIMPTEMTGSGCFVFWQEDQTGFRELWSRGGVVETTAPDPIALLQHPFPPVRPFDPVSSENLQLSACAFDVVTGQCDPVRADGEVSHVAADETALDVFVVWYDTRSSDAGIYFKRTDREVMPPGVTLSTDCADAGPFIDVQWSPLSCDMAADPMPERMGRYLVYYGTTSTGPYDNYDIDGSDPNVPDTIIVDDDGTLPDPVSVQITGLAENMPYYIIVVPEDQAWNLFPPDFDPLNWSPPNPPSNEVSITTPACVCLNRSQATAIAPMNPVKSEIFLSSPTPLGISLNDAAPLAEVPYLCPFTTGASDPDPVLAPGSNPLIFYQISSQVPVTIQVVKDTGQQTVAFSF